jgi:hypothetical protein
MLTGIVGGVIIGVAVSIMLLFNGRVTGISGILGGLIVAPRGDRSWRWSFILGLLAGGAVLLWFSPASPASSIPATAQVVIAGLLVGFGTLLGNGCTSGHGVCGISRLSIRSIVATVTFIFAGVVTVYLTKVFT